MAWRLPKLPTYLLVPVPSIILEIMISSYLDLGLLFMANIHSLTYPGPVIWSKLDISIRSSKSLDIFKKRIKLVNFTSLLDSTCKDCFFM